jgi:hypothetical protein
MKKLFSDGPSLCKENVVGLRRVTAGTSISVRWAATAHACDFETVRATLTIISRLAGAVPNLEVLTTTLLLREKERVSYFQT